MPGLEVPTAAAQHVVQIDVRLKPVKGDAPSNSASVVTDAAIEKEVPTAKEETGPAATQAPSESKTEDVPASAGGMSRSQSKAADVVLRSDSKQDVKNEIDQKEEKAEEKADEKVEEKAEDKGGEKEADSDQKAENNASSVVEASLEEVFDKQGGSLTGRVLLLLEMDKRLASTFEMRR